jgi:dihydrofolate reductase
MARKVVYQCAVSLDGYIEDHERKFDWCLTDFDYDMQAFIDSVDTYLYGRTTYELMFRMGESFDADKKHVVFSSSLKEIAPNCDLVSASPIDFVKSLLKEDGKDIWLFGGAILAGSLAGAGLVHELQLAVHPIVLGGGTPLFLGLNKRLPYFPVDSQKYENGLVMMTYKLGENF